MKKSSKNAAASEIAGETNNSPDNYCKPEDKIPLKEQILYGAADLFGGGQAAFLSVILLAFLTDIVGIAAAIAGTIITVSKLWDAISDPAMGIISENTRWSKLGRRKPYMIIGGILIPFGLAFLFAPVNVNSLGQIGAVVWMVFAYIVYCTISTISQVPFMSMASDISMDYKQRNKANTWKLLFDVIASGLLYLIPTLLWNPVKDGTLPYTTFYYIVVFGFGLLFGIPLIIGGLTVKERAPYDMTVKAKFNFKEYFKGLSVKSYIWHIIMYVTAFLTLDMVSALAIYYTDNIGGHAWGVEVFGIQMSSFFIIGPMMICAAIGIVIAYAIKAKYSKQAAYRTLLPFYIIGAILLAIYQPSWNMPWLIPIFAAVMGLGFAGPQSMPWLVFPDTVDVAELKLGYRPTGNMSAVMTFLRKAATALGVGMVGWVLGGAGYIASAADGTPSPVQPDSVVFAIRILLCVSVVVLLSAGYFASVKYRVTNKKLDRIRYFNEKRENGGFESLTLAEQVELDDLKKELC